MRAVIIRLTWIAIAVAVLYGCAQVARLVPQVQREASLSSSVFTSAFVAGDYPTNHFDNRRTGWNPHETILTTSNVNSSRFGRLWTAQIDSRAYAQPIVAMAENVGGATHNVVFVGTANDSLYAFDADSGSVLWHRSLGTAVPQSFYNKTDFSPSLGIMGSPAYDRSRHSLYVLAATLVTTNGKQHILQTLHQISVSDGKDIHAPVSIAGSTTLANGTSLSFDADVTPNRAALLEANGNIYIAFGSFDDAYGRSQHGWVFAYNASTFAQVGFFCLSRQVAPDGKYRASVWQSGIGPAADANGNIFFATGDGYTDGVYDFGDSAVRLPPNLSAGGLQFWAPPTWQMDYSLDKDLGSGALMLLPTQPGTYPQLLWVDGKQYHGYLMNADKLTGISSSANPGFVAEKATHVIYGAATFFQDSNGVAWLYTSDDTANAAYLAQYKVTTSPKYSITLVNRAHTPFTRINGATPTVSSNGNTPGTAIVWYLDRPQSTGPVMLYALDASNISNQLFNAVSGQWTISSDFAFLEPTVANGKVYVASDYELTAFGLLH